MGKRYTVTAKQHKRKGALFSSLLIIPLLLLSSCIGAPQAPQTHAAPRATTLSTENSTHAISPTTQVDQQDDAILNMHALHLMSQQMNGPDGWLWHTDLPNHRLVLFYGNPLSPVMGPIGQYSDSDLMARLDEQAQAYATLDPAHDVVPGLDYVTPVVQSEAMDDGSWVYRMPSDSVEHYIDLANSHHALFFFDLQIGHSTVQKEINLLWPYIQRPGVDVALDPEFDMPPGAIPDQVFGHMTAAEINWVIDQLSNLVTTHHLPPKTLIVHQFLQEMLPDWQNIKLKPGVQVVTCVDGFGTPGEKIDDYRMFDKDQLIQYPGMKMFYKLDTPMMSPADVLALDPPPAMVMYQ